MKKILALIMCVALAFTAVARPHCGPRPGGFGPHFPPVHHVRPHYIHAPSHHHHHHVAPLVTGGAIAGGIIVGSLIADAITPRRETVVVTTPAVSQTTVAAVPVATPIYSSAEVIGVNPAPVVYHQTQVQRVWVPGHYETRYLGNGVTTQVYVPGYWQ